eukprot:Amastigsp_a513869_75.p2 type:complete len:154 gc:universal Amastigsp_a513869_75:710-249(-)
MTASTSASERKLSIANSRGSSASVRSTIGFPSCPATSHRTAVWFTATGGQMNSSSRGTRYNASPSWICLMCSSCMPEPLKTRRCPEGTGSRLSRCHASYASAKRVLSAGRTGRETTSLRSAVVLPPLRKNVTTKVSFGRLASGLPGVSSTVES